MYCMKTIVGLIALRASNESLAVVCRRAGTVRSVKNVPVGAKVLCGFVYECAFFSLFSLIVNQKASCDMRHIGMTMRLW